MSADPVGLAQVCILSAGFIALVLALDGLADIIIDRTKDPP